ncbi:DEAD/DEAH box helicase [Eggerthellaceae bacterium zg-1084]|uniref:DEAD/DEAH box helicase n=1 Tax=Berryella wangjianweii TaxID=2734634 RepID=UPI0015573A59|nr:DEAD/DEAH box helicase [Berryella wangjianweii]NPD30506.1 DEAD/DEAH box helicase [Berryella wangjianweii]
MTTSTNETAENTLEASAVKAATEEASQAQAANAQADKADAPEAAVAPKTEAANSGAIEDACTTTTTARSDSARATEQAATPRPASEPVAPAAAPAIATADGIRFSDLGLSENVLKAVKSLGYETPTPVQAQAIPLVLKGSDLCAAAATGTGKTAAFLLPTMSRLPRARKGGGPRMLVVTPTRELAQQIGDVCFAISRSTRHFQCTVYGGTKYGPQITKLKRGVDILIATPGRLNDLRERGVVNLRDIDVLVIDEADRMLDMGFWPSMESIIAETPTTRQTLLFSATLDRKVMRSVAPILRNPATVEVARSGETARTVDQYVMPIEHRKKQELLQAVLQEKGFDRVIVFTRTKNRAEDCCEQLRAAGFSAESIHSDKTQHKRKRALEGFAKGRTNVLVATDVLARGIDVPSVSYVVNYDLPDMAEDYVHRIGRTGRAGEVGYAISFVSRESRTGLKDIERLIERELPTMPLETYQLDESVLAAKQKKAKKKPSRARDVERAQAHKRGRAGDGPREFRGIARGQGKPYRSAGDGASPAAGRSAAAGRKPGDGGRYGRDERDSRDTRGRRGAARSDRFGSGRDNRFERSDRFDRPARSDRDGRDARGGRPEGREAAGSRKPGRFERKPGTGTGWKGERGQADAYGFVKPARKGGKPSAGGKNHRKGSGPRATEGARKAPVDGGFYDRFAKKPKARD